MERDRVKSWNKLGIWHRDMTGGKAMRELRRWRRQSMKSAEVVDRDRKGQTLHIGDEVLVYSYDRKPIGQGEVVSMTLVLLEPVSRYVDLHMGVIGDKRYRTSCGAGRARKDRGGRRWQRLTTSGTRASPTGLAPTATALTRARAKRATLQDGGCS
jgi:hypothetical protein